MTHYQERLERDLNEIREKVLGVSCKVEDQVRDGIHAILTFEKDLAYRIILGDREVNRRILELDRLCHAFVVRHLPVAGHLRFVSAVLRLDVALERVGDYAVVACREAVRLSGPPPTTVARDIELISQQARRALSQALKAFHDNDLELARSTFGLAAQLDATYEKVFDDLIAAGERRERPLRDVFSMLRIMNVVQRVGDQAENIARETLFTVAGETKEPKTYRILFVDRRNDCESLMAEAYARKAFHEAGEYASAGWEPAAGTNPMLHRFLDRQGMDARGLSPKKLVPPKEEPRHYHVIIALEKGVREHLGQIPFKSVYLEWDLGLRPEHGEEALSDKRLQDLYETIAFRLRDLMETLRGSDQI